jgi:hypothetical protein
MQPEKLKPLNGNQDLEDRRKTMPMIYYETIKPKRDDRLNESDKKRLGKTTKESQLSLKHRFQTKMSELTSKSRDHYQNTPAQSTQEY